MPDNHARRGLRADGTPAMTPAEFRATREMLGLSIGWIADMAQVNPRNARKWDQGMNPVPEGIAQALDKIARDTALYVEKVASKRALDPDFEFKVPQATMAKEDRELGEDWGYWSMGWWWNVGGRVLDADRKARGGAIVYVDAAEEGPSVKPPAVPSVPRPPHAQHQRATY